MDAFGWQIVPGMTWSMRKPKKGLFCKMSGSKYYHGKNKGFPTPHDMIPEKSDRGLSPPSTVPRIQGLPGPHRSSGTPGGTSTSPS